MSAQPEALRLANECYLAAAMLPGSNPKRQSLGEATAELRRLNALNADLLAALKEAGACIRGDWSNGIDVIDAAISKAEGGAA